LNCLLFAFSALAVQKSVEESPELQGSLIRICGFVVPFIYLIVSKISGYPSDDISPIKILPGFYLSSSEYRSLEFGSIDITYFTTFLSSAFWLKGENISLTLFTGRFASEHSFLIPNEVVCY